MEALNKLEGRALFVTGVRLAFGIWLAYIGLGKWVNGASGFVGYITQEFAKTWSPGFLNMILAWTILVAEPAIGLWILSGRNQKLAWIAASALMFLLLFGKTITGDYATVANTWHYFVLTLACASLCEKE